ncbi:MAG: hypothetical protein MMC23_008933 [Stictis urceolatum]|nr:hypothetical protein [Stictis urceolata]
MSSEKISVATQFNDHAQSSDKVLITGATGGVGVFLVQKLAGFKVVAAVSSKSRTEEILRSLRASEVIEYTDLHAAHGGDFTSIVDTIGGTVLEGCWSLVEDGRIVSIESASWNFVKEHRERGIAAGKDRVTALFFIVEPTQDDLSTISALIDQERLRVYSGITFLLASVRYAYDICHGRSNLAGRVRGKVVFTM